MSLQKYNSNVPWSLDLYTREDTTPIIDADGRDVQWVAIGNFTKNGVGSKENMRNLWSTLMRECTCNPLGPCGTPEGLIIVEGWVSCLLAVLRAHGQSSPEVHMTHWHGGFSVVHVAFIGVLDDKQSKACRKWIVNKDLCGSANFYLQPEDYHRNHQAAIEQDLADQRNCDFVLAALGTTQESSSFSADVSRTWFLDSSAEIATDLSSGSHMETDISNTDLSRIDHNNNDSMNDSFLLN